MANARSTSIVSVAANARSTSIVSVAADEALAHGWVSKKNITGREHHWTRRYLVLSHVPRLARTYCRPVTEA